MSVQSAPRRSSILATVGSALLVVTGGALLCPRRARPGMPAGNGTGFTVRAKHKRRQRGRARG
ncbi:hypothetical protein [Micromonospora sp. NPDC047074]|uniref:hypothetical protein n=1 Tax=Micromonospora sp. NPDC047074 TaxID=3154339 RepID=UPI0033F98260